MVGKIEDGTGFENLPLEEMVRFILSWLMWIEN
jgi:hypothetical protein